MMMKTVTLMLAAAGALGHRWTGIEVSRRLSDPSGAFTVFVARDSGPKVPAALKVFARLDDEGRFAVCDRCLGKVVAPNAERVLLLASDSHEFGKVLGRLAHGYVDVGS